MGKEKRKNRLDKGNVGVSSGEFIGFGAFATETATSGPSNVSGQVKLRCSPVYTGSDSILSIQFKKIGQKKDGSTKAKALEQVKKFFEDDLQSKKEQAKALEHLIFLYHAKLNYDDFSAVRCESLLALAAARNRVSKAWATLLDQEPEVFGMVWCASSDPSLEVRLASQKLLKDASKKAWWNGLWRYVSRMLGYGRPKNMFEELFARRSDNAPMTDSEREELDERYERLLVTTISGLTTWMEKFPETEEQLSSRYDNFITDSILWKALTSSRSPFRRASYQLLGTMCQHQKSVVYGPVGSKSLPKLFSSIVAQEKEAANIQALFEVLLLYLKFYNADELKVEDIVKSLNKVLKKACYSASPSFWGPAVLPLLVSIGEDHLILSILRSMLEGRSATIGLSDHLSITCFAAESCSFFLLRSDAENPVDDATSISIAELWLECLKSYSCASGITSVSRSSDNELKTIIGKSLCRFDEAAHSKENCAFYRVKEWFWDEQLPTTLRSGSTQLECQRFYKIIREVSENQKTETGNSHILPLIRQEFQNHLVKSNLSSAYIPSEVDYEFYETCMEFCFSESLFFSDDTSSPDGVTLESFLMNKVLRWLVVHSSKMQPVVSGQHITQALHAFSCLHICLLITHTTQRQQSLWRAFFRELIKADCNLMILAKGLLVMCAKNTSTRKKSIETVIASDVLDDFATRVVADALIRSEAKLNLEEFLRVCAGLDCNLASPLVNRVVMSQWVGMLSLDQDFSDNDSATIVLRTLLDVADDESTLSYEDKLKALTLAWRTGGENWRKACTHILTKDVSRDLYNDFLHASENELQSSLNRICDVGLDVKRPDLYERSRTWSKRAIRWFRNNDSHSGFEKLNRIGLGNIEMWQEAIPHLERSERLRWCISSFLQGLEDDAERFLLFFDDQKSDDRVHLFTCILIATSSNPEKKLYEIHDPPLICFFGGCKSFGSDLIKKCVNRYLYAIKESFGNTLSKKKSISSFSDFICEIFPAYLSDEKCYGREIAQKDTFIKGEEVWYTPDLDQEDTQIKAMIMKVHDDDFPRLYFTIRFETEKMEQEKQTVAERLKKFDSSLQHSNSSSAISADDHLLRKSLSSSILTEIVMPAFNSPDLKEKEQLEVAAECLNLVLARIGCLGKGGIGTYRYDLCQALLKLQEQAKTAIDEEKQDLAATLLRVLSLALGFRELTPGCNLSSEYLNFDPEASLASMVTLYGKKSADLLELYQPSLMWIIVTLRCIKAPSLQKELSSLVVDILNKLSFEKEQVSLLALKVLIELHNCKISDNFVGTASEASVFSKVIDSFAKDWQLKEPDEFTRRCLNTDKGVERETWWWEPLETFLKCYTGVKIDILSNACRETTPALIAPLSIESKRWFAFRLLCLGAKIKDPIHSDVDEKMLDRETQSRLSHWKKGMIDDDIDELEDDILTVVEWVPAKLMVEIESWIDDQSYFDNPTEVITISRMLSWLVFLEYLETAAADDVRNRISFSSYGNKTGAVFFMLSSCLIFLDAKNNGNVTRNNVNKIGDVLRQQENVRVDYLAMTVLFHTIEVFPTLSRIWWEEDCPKSFSASVSIFVQKMVAPETLRRELLRIHNSKSLGEMSVQGSIKSREVTATYLQDECTLSIAINVPPNFPLKNAEVDGKKTLGIPENRFKRWSLQIRQIINNQDGTLLDALLLWKKNVEKEFEGVEPCPVCYSVLSVKTHDLPNLECKTCGNCFHSSCLYKWFASSGKNQCVICQQPWNGTRIQ
mmetsp:Transcript_15507/g.23800  ORF Transcript_15507/g.23800 Transcript_15507/m.23800 type:complete len:1749 (+) Transcript_15507:124-5370(+)|eukprot:CAMPEP_0194252842 /NCGR_PEP_ID=MMETSP0158-20130606/28579_1 /TAXON_ID=33649 /ORGANISM="Thalassionema nitzschioides, Strain L26-B" /LENGTH=1748 /DNA_ID=CAMNT_0038990363 /DNA_START=86 /DNA_END=5332 /DNA_ORIENTATION=+